MADTDLLSLAEAQKAVNLTSADHDAELASFVSGVSLRIADLCGPVVIHTVTNEAHNGGGTRIWLRQTPASSVTSITEYSGTVSTSLTEETNSVKPADAFLLDHVGNASFVWRRAAGSDHTFPAGRRNVLVTYEAGRFADTGSVDDKFKSAASSILRRFWKREQSAWAQSANYFPDVEEPGRLPGFFRVVDPVVKELLGDELKPPSVA